MPVELSDEQDDPLELDHLRSVVDAVLRGEGVPDSTLVSLSFVDRDAMTTLNETHMDKTGPTDVLSFPIEVLTPGEMPDAAPDAPPLMLGDVVICPDVVRQQAQGAAVAFHDEMALMVVHGLLHLLGYDHERDDDAEVMERRERDLLALAGRVRP